MSCVYDSELISDLIKFRELEKSISNKNAIRACLLVLSGIAGNAALPYEDSEAAK